MADSKFRRSVHIFRRIKFLRKKQFCASWRKETALPFLSRTEYDMLELLVKSLMIHSRPFIKQLNAAAAARAPAKPFSYPAIHYQARRRGQL